MGLPVLAGPACGPDRGCGLDPLTPGKRSRRSPHNEPHSALGVVSSGNASRLRVHPPRRCHPRPGLRTGTRGGPVGTSRCGLSSESQQSEGRSGEGRRSEPRPCRFHPSFGLSPGPCPRQSSGPCHSAVRDLDRTGTPKRHKHQGTREPFRAQSAGCTRPLPAVDRTNLSPRHGPGGWAEGAHGGWERSSGGGCGGV